MHYHTCKGDGQLSKPKCHLLHIYNLGNTIFAWFILSWIIHRNSSFNRINFVLQVWYKFLHDSWYNICFFSLASYFIVSLLLFPNLDIKSFKDSQTMHFAKTKPCFQTLTFKWCLFLNLFIAYWKIFLMFNSLFICQPTNIKKQRNIKFSMIDVCCQIYIQKSISISQKIVFHKKHLAATKRLLPYINKNKKC